MFYSAAFASSQVLGVQEDVQLREQDFGNFQGECFLPARVRGGVVHEAYQVKEQDLGNVQGTRKMGGGAFSTVRSRAKPLRSGLHAMGSGVGG